MSIRDYLMQISIKDATLNDLNEVNSILRISKSYWSYNNEFIDSFMKKFSITPEYLKNHVIKLFYIDDHLAGFYNFETNLSFRQACVTLNSTNV